MPIFILNKPYEPDIHYNSNAIYLSKDLKAGYNSNDRCILK